MAQRTVRLDQVANLGCGSDICWRLAQQEALIIDHQASSQPYRHSSKTDNNDAKKSPSRECESDTCSFDCAIGSKVEKHSHELSKAESSVSMQEILALVVLLVDVGHRSKDLLSVLRCRCRQSVSCNLSEELVDVLAGLA